MPPTRAEYAKINIACKDLNIDKYDLIADRYGKSSTKDLTRQQTWDLLDHFKKLGWKPKRSKKKTTSPQYNEGYKNKVVALWITLHKAGVVKNSSDQALQKYVKRLTKKENLKWCDSGDCYSLIESLKNWAKREDVDVEY